MDKYENPLCTRYASKQMQYIFSPDNKFQNWRKLWYSLAKAQKKLGLAKARPIIHLGVTSAFVGDNTDLIQIKEALILVKKRLLVVMESLVNFADKYKEVPCLSYTHFQAAQLSTVGKRASLWLKSFVYDFYEIDKRINNLEFRGVKGTTGTGASFKELFGDNYEKMKELDRLVTEESGFKKCQEISSQTYDRKQDTYILQTLASLADSAYKMTNDFRLLQHEKEIEEPFEKNQIGSSAMAYKRNPMRCERVSALAKFVISLEMNGHLVHSSQWLERTLDDSANKRLSYPQAFLAIDAILIILENILDGVVVYKKMIEKNIRKELGFMATENIMMDAVKKGMDRQEVHEIIRTLSMEEVKSIKIEGKENHLIDRIVKDGRLGLTMEDMEKILDPKQYIGFSVEQTKEYLSKVRKILDDNNKFLRIKKRGFNFMIEENIRKLLDSLKESNDNLIQAEYLFDELREYISDKKDIYKKILEEYDQDELNKIVKASYQQYVKRARKLFFKEIIGFCIYMLIVCSVIVFGLHAKSDMLLIYILGAAGIFCIIRSVAYKKNLEKISKLEYEKGVSEEIKRFVEGLKNE